MILPRPGEIWKWSTLRSEHYQIVQVIKVYKYKSLKIKVKILKDNDNRFLNDIYSEDLESFVEDFKLDLNYSFKIDLKSVL